MNWGWGAAKNVVAREAGTTTGEADTASFAKVVVPSVLW